MSDKYYFLSALIGFAIVLGVYFLFPQQRKMMFLSGLCLTPFSIFSIFHDQIYWNPKRIFDFPFGLEDIIFCFSVGSLVWFFASYPRRFVSSQKMDIRKFLKRISFLIFIGACEFIVLIKFGIDVMNATILIQIAFVIAAIFLCTKTWKPIFSAGIGYTIYYTLMLLLFFSIFPEFKNAWNGAYLWPLFIGVIPLQEIVWISTFSMAWTWILIFCADFYSDL